MSTLLTLSTHTTPAAVVVAAEGEIDLATAQDFADGLAAAAVAGLPLVVDLDGVRFLGSAGLAVLVSAATEGVNLVVVAGEGTVTRRALSLSGLDAVLTAVDDRESALRAPRS
ncbi:STAS domain-containing protein [Actinokineospora soli]|uniref:Anti-sigma factor antagonist n=1 Tax=Actinokineospora soli TaxID=1048753 RepID=A0ABW2TQ58_9PSEU